MDSAAESRSVNSTLMRQAVCQAQLVGSLDGTLSALLLTSEGGCQGQLHQPASSSIAPRKVSLRGKSITAPVTQLHHMIGCQVQIASMQAASGHIFYLPGSSGMVADSTCGPEPVSVHSMQPSIGVCVRDSHPHLAWVPPGHPSACQLLCKTCADLFPALYRKREREEEPLLPSRGAKQPRINVMGQVEGQHLLAACDKQPGTLLYAAENLLCVTWLPSFMLSVFHWCLS